MGPNPDECEVKRLQLRLGLISVADVVSWADNIILESDIPDNEIIDLALSRRLPLADVIAQLAKMAGGCDRNRAMRTVLGQMYHVLQKDRSLARGFSRTLFQEAVENSGYINYSEDILFIYGNDDCFDLAEQGIYGTIDTVTDEFIEYLRTFSDLSEKSG